MAHWRGQVARLIDGYRRAGAGRGDLMSLAVDILAALVIASPEEVRAAAPLLSDLGRRIDQALHGSTR